MVVTGKVFAGAVLARQSRDAGEGATPARAGPVVAVFTSAFLIDVAVLLLASHLPGTPQTVAWWVRASKAASRSCSNPPAVGSTRFRAHPEQIWDDPDPPPGATFINADNSPRSALPAVWTRTTCAPPHGHLPTRKATAAAAATSGRSDHGPTSTNGGLSFRPLCILQA